MVSRAEPTWLGHSEPHLWLKEAGISSNSQRLLGDPPKRKVSLAVRGCGRQSPVWSWRRSLELGLLDTYME